MKALVLGGMFLLFTGVIVALVHAEDAGKSAPKSDVPDCVDYWGEARYGAYGYNHIVHVANQCKQAADCRVSTNVNPDWQQVTVPAGKEKEVTTYMASPARTFTPYVKCKLE